MRDTHLKRCRSILLLAGCGLLLGLASSEVQAHPSPKHRGYKKLLEKGVSIAIKAQGFRFRGLVQGQEPVVVDFELPRDGHLEVKVRVLHPRRRTFRLEFPATADARMIDHKALPAGVGDWNVGRVSLAAFDAAGKKMPFRFFGIGVGERAVGSTAIYAVIFDPPTLRGDEPARWRFRSHEDFEKARIAVYERETPNSAPGWEEDTFREFDSPCQPQSGKECDGTWDALDPKGRRVPGRYRVGIKAWLTSYGSDWILKLSGDVVAVE